jgi:hypothetical protein
LASKHADRAGIPKGDAIDRAGIGAGALAEGSRVDNLLAPAAIGLDALSPCTSITAPAWLATSIPVALNCSGLAKVIVPQLVTAACKYRVPAPLAASRPLAAMFNCP